MKILQHSDVFKERGSEMMMSDRLLVCGSREFTDEAAGFAFLDQLAAGRQIAVVIEGGARGGDAVYCEFMKANSHLLYKPPSFLNSHR